jgi:hypothetical protein
MRAPPPASFGKGGGEPLTPWAWSDFAIGRIIAKEVHMGEVAKSIPQDAPFTPRTELGRRLAALRAEILASGIPLLSPADLEKELVEMRGATPDEADP